MFVFIALAFLLCCQSCIELRPDLPDSRPADFPGRFSLYTPADNELDPWWQSFVSPELESLAIAAMENNLDLHVAWARLDQARAVAIKVGAARFPDVKGSGGGDVSRTDNSNGSEDSEQNIFFGLDASYEVDLWGRVRATTENARLQLQASRADLHAAALSISGEVGGAWIDLLSARQKEKQLVEQFTVNRKLLELIELRFSMARASALDVYQQNQTVKAIEGALISVKADQQLKQHQLALLIGRSATTELALTEINYPLMSPVPATGLPADLLARRPDIRAAGLRLKGSNWEVAAARADRLPRLTLNGSALTSADVVEALLDSWILQLAGNIVGPVFDGGTRRAEVERTRAVTAERLASYRKIVLTAIREVETALVEEEAQRQTLENINQQIDLTERAYREATWRYLNGSSDFLPVLREQVNLINQQLDRISAGARLYNARIALYKSLGGSWPENLQPPQKRGDPLDKNNDHE